MSASFLANLAQSERKATAYWGALRAAALLRSGEAQVEVATLHLQSLVWPMTVYRTDAPADMAGALAAEASLFEGRVLHDGRRFQFLVGARAPDGCEYLDVAASDALTSRLSEALALIAAQWPAALAESQALTRGVAFVETSKRFSSTSDPKLFGLIHIDRGFFAERSAAELATAILHESGHHALFVASASAKMIATPEKLLYSPLRKENRPAIGVLHAAVALYRMIAWGTRLGTAAPAEARRIRLELVPKFAATLTELGQIEFLDGGLACQRDLEQLSL
jgi:HEXXH motif-containing protein